MPVALFVVGAVVVAVAVAVGTVLATRTSGNEAAATATTPSQAAAPATTHATGAKKPPARAVVPPRELKHTTRSASVALGPARPLTWKPAASASFYDVVLMRGKARVADFWPDRPTLSLSTLRSRPALRPGTYNWFVYPGYGNRNRGANEPTFYGKLLARGVLTIPAGA